MTERFLGVLEDGPFPGEYVFPDDDEDDEHKVVKWPLPKYVFAQDTKPGAYVKTWESSGEPKSDGELRGARYTWDAQASGFELSK